MRHLITLAFVGAAYLGFGQNFAEMFPAESPKPKDTTELTEPRWLMSSIFGANGTQSSFVNWNSGGRNNISLLGFINAQANYEHRYYDWDNTLSIALGGLQYLDANADALQKTDDRIELSSKIGYRLKQKKHFYLSFIGGFRTQFLDGFQYPDNTNPVSTFMAPGYINFALGIDYKPSKNFSVFLSPIASKMTFVKDRTLADAGAFGVEPAQYDATTGNLIAPGEQFRYELGAYFRMLYNVELAKNIEMKSRLELFSNYIEEPQNIDVNADVLFNFKVNSWFSASANFTLIYDHDIMITDVDGNTGPRTQFKSVLGVGISYTLRNFEEKNKK